MTQQEMALLMAYNQIVSSERFTIPASPTAAQLVLLQKAQAEQALFLLANVKGIDKRLSVQAQGVGAAGVVKEGFSRNPLQGRSVVIGPRACSYLKDFRRYGKGFKFDYES